MGRPLRFIPPGSVVEITTRTIQSRLLLRPSPELNRIVLGVLGRTLSRYAVQVHAFVVMSNHIHLLASPTNAQQLAAFMQYFNGNLSKEVGRLHDWEGPLWERRYRAIVIADEQSQIERLRYIFEQGCKEGLVASPRHWPGATSVHSLLDGRPLFGTWLDRSALYAARRTGKKLDASKLTYRYTIGLAPLPCWAGLSAKEYRRRCAQLVRDIEHETKARNAQLGRRPMGAKFIYAQNPHDIPSSPSKSPAPLVHAATRKARQEFLAAYRQFVNEYRRAAERLRSGYRNVTFPLHSFPPAQPFVAGT